MSLLNNQKGLSNWTGYRHVFTRNIVLTGGSVLLGAAAMSIAGVHILGIFGKDFKVGNVVLILVLLSAVPEAIAMAIVQVVHSQARLWLSFFAIALPKDCTLILLAYLLTPRYRAAGLAAAYGGAWFLTLISVLVTARMSWPGRNHDHRILA